MLGDLWNFPFPVAVWGTAAAWFGAAGTTLAFLLAATAYRRDVKLRRYEQAIMVRIHEKSKPPLGLGALNPENLILEVHNTSDKYIYSVNGLLRRKPLHRFVSDLIPSFPRKKFEKPSNAELQEKLQNYRDVVEKFSFGVIVDRVEPGGVARLEFSIGYTYDHELVVHFMDAQNQLWRIRDDRHIDFTGKEKPRLEFVGTWFIWLVKLSTMFNFIFSPPHRTARLFWNRAALRIWALKNAPWGPGVEGWTQKTDFSAGYVQLEDTATGVGTEQLDDDDSSHNEASEPGQE